MRAYEWRASQPCSFGAKFWKLSQVLRGLIDHLEIVDMQVDSCLALAMNTCTGTAMYKSIDDMLIHFGKLEPFG